MLIRLARVSITKGGAREKREKEKRQRRMVCTRGIENDRQLLLTGCRVKFHAIATSTLINSMAVPAVNIISIVQREWANNLFGNRGE